jgi:hypothetical protein
VVIPDEAAGESAVLSIGVELIFENEFQEVRDHLPETGERRSDSPTEVRKSKIGATPGSIARSPVKQAWTASDHERVHEGRN